ncbi:hypothetical protein BV22DRAFT_1193589 [Leucogyrophana mollusca]|uniref:Uncharacterized protein n=1 Tax=Leucogyrophana mollusca TaxID=85980 RepID=A0ACB8BPK0_9AGAM|nr:hypothetical protein BV22DRAFT_1193589 [Leucogyrophana mollusca]
MSISIARDVISGINFIANVVAQVKDNKEELYLTSKRLQHILSTIEGCRKRDTVKDDEYDHAMVALLHLVRRAERITRMQLQRSLGDRTWNRNEIASEIKRLRDDIDNYLSAHTIRALNETRLSNEQNFQLLSSNIEEVMTRLAELDIRLKIPGGQKWPERISSQAGRNIENDLIRADADLLKIKEEQLQRVGSSAPDLLHTLSESAKATTSIQVSGLRYRGAMKFRKRADPTVTIPNVKINGTLEDVQLAIRDAGYEAPPYLSGGHMAVTVTDDVAQYDAHAPGGLQIPKTIPLIWWWNKFNAYHGLAPATTPSHNFAKLAQDGRSVFVAGVEFRYHQTLRVPESKTSRLPPTLGQFPLEPVAKFGNRIPEVIRKKGGFILPMFQREAMWMSFHQPGRAHGPAIKISIGGVNAVTGVANDTITPPNHQQDYVVAGLQPWLDGIMTSSGTVRQFVAMPHGQNYTVEEQVTGKAQHGGFQFDVFPVRDQSFAPYRSGERSKSLAHYETPAETGMIPGDSLDLVRNGLDPMHAHWTLSNHQGRPGALVHLKATYQSDIFASPRAPTSVSDPFTEAYMGIAAGGQITQKIYSDQRSVRLYDEDRGHRFHVHILTPEAWEVITGVVAPITPVTAEAYRRNNVPWFSLSDDHMAGLQSSGPLSSVKSVAQLDQEKHIQSGGDIDPNKPPGCSLHNRSPSACVFRPCSHTACNTCLGTAMMKRMQCPMCSAKIARIVGMTEAVPQVVESGDDEGTLAWDVAQIEELAITASDSRNISIIHLEEDRVPPLHGEDA